MPIEDRREELGSLVVPGDNRFTPIHRWFPYKEAYSYRLPRKFVAQLGIGQTGRVADVFGGVATTALSLQTQSVTETVSVEYSPLAQFVGEVKLSWPELDPGRLRRVAKKLLSFRVSRGVQLPELAAFRNPEIFPPATAKALVAARTTIDLAGLAEEERDFFLVGLAAVVEDLSGAKKDGRALRIMRDRRRRRSSLIGEGALRPGLDGVRTALARQWEGMINDLVLEDAASHDLAPASHIQGDARDLGAVMKDGEPALGPESVGLFVYSPPYLNFIDYSEIYKMELWLLEFITLQEEFRELRLGTLRSHPSIDFPERDYLNACSDVALHGLIRALADFVIENGARPNVGRAIYGYFDDMFQALTEQYRTLEPGGHACCVVGNSTFSRRASRAESWRLPLLTDVLIGGLARAVGFEDVHIREARELRPRNVKSGGARESAVVMRKPAN